MTLCETNIEKINNAFNVISDASFQEKREHLSKQQVIDSFLDRILDLKEKLTTKSKKIEKIVVMLEGITWYNNVDEEGLKLINEIISLSKDLHSTLIRFYVDLNYFIKKNIAKEEIKNLKIAIDDLKEITQDLESVFFYLPQMPQFVESTKQLSLL
jgi:hypothetical protein